MEKKKSVERAVIVTTEYKGVFFGFAEDTSGDTVDLKRARNVIYWPSSVGGFMGLALGPKEGCRVGPAVDIQLRKVTSVIAVKKEAVAKWEEFIWTP